MEIKNSKFRLNDAEFDFGEEKVDKKQEVKEEVKYCKKCKSKNVLKAKFCFECGHNEFYMSLEEMEEVSKYKYCARASVYNFVAKLSLI